MRRRIVLATLCLLVGWNAGCGSNKKKYSAPVDVPHADAAGEGGQVPDQVTEEVRTEFSLLTPPTFAPKSFNIVVEADTYMAAPGQEVQLAARIVRGLPEGETHWDWNFGGGEGAADQGQTAVTTFAKAGSFLVSVTATDEAGNPARSGAYVTVVAPDVQYLVGDVNGNGQLSPDDVQLVQLHNAGDSVLTGQQFHRADVDLDGKVTYQDEELLSLGLDNGLAPAALLATSGVPSNPVMLIHPSLLDPSAVAQVRFAPDLSVAPVRVLPGYASFAIPPDAVGADSVRLIVESQETAQFPLEVKPLPSAQGPAG